MQRAVGYCVNSIYRSKQSKAIIKRYYKKGESVFRVGEPSSAVFLLISGEVGLFFSDRPVGTLYAHQGM